MGLVGFVHRENSYDATVRTLRCLVMYEPSAQFTFQSSSIADSSCRRGEAYYEYCEGRGKDEGEMEDA